MTPQAKLDETDWQLLGLLQKNARATNKSLARDVGIAESTCLERIRGLQQRGVILGFRAEVDLAAIGRPIRAFISVRLQPKTTKSVTEFQHELLRTAEVLSVATVTGSDDFVVDVAVTDVDHLRAFVLDRITSRPQVVDTRTALVYDHQRSRSDL